MPVNLSSALQSWTSPNFNFYLFIHSLKKSKKISKDLFFKAVFFTQNYQICIQTTCVLKYLFQKKRLASTSIPENPSSIGLILTKNQRSFQSSCVIETGISDFHRMVLTVMKTSFERLIVIGTINLSKNSISREELLYEWPNSTFEKKTNDFEEFIHICQRKL